MIKTSKQEHANKLQKQTYTIHEKKRTYIHKHEHTHRETFIYLFAVFVDVLFKKIV